MHAELQRLPELDYMAHAKLLPTTALNSRFPGWALDGYDVPIPKMRAAASSAAPGGPPQPKLQFALHLFATTGEERVAVFSGLHKRALCPAALVLPPADKDGKLSNYGKQAAAEQPPLWELPPAALAPSIAGDSIAALGERAAAHPKNSFPNAELCLAVYTFAAGAGGGAGKAYHPIYGMTERHQVCHGCGVSAVCTPCSLLAFFQQLPLIHRFPLLLLSGLSCS